ncbi:uncharacterized protein LOC135836290 [Planococcus citri]|uniref:uncharacterized protein LOC135836290 n=1 Tax=Planococcus citri TaxID=170843 RepID=UPI0031F860E0
MMAGIIKVTILFVVIYQVTKLNEATTLNRPSAEDAQSSTFAENANQTSTEDVAEPSTSDESVDQAPAVEDTLETPSTVETPGPSVLEEPADENATPQPLEVSSDISTSGDEPPQTPQETPGRNADENNDVKFTATDPLEINKIAFEPLIKLFGGLGPLIYDLLTDKNALGEQMAVVSKLIADRVTLEKYSEDIDLILSNLINPTVKSKVQEIYSKIEDVEVQGTTNRKLKDAVQIIKDILEDENALNEIDDIIKTGPV